MAPNRLLPPWGHLSAGVADDLDNHLADVSSDLVIQCPAQHGLPEVIRIVDEFPIYISSDEEEDSEVVLIEDDSEGDDIPPISEDDEEEDREEDEDEEDFDDDDDLDLEGSEDWTSDDSGYDTLSEDEEEVEDDDNDDDGRHSPLVQEFPPEEFLHGWRQEVPPVPADVAQHEEQLPQVFPLAGPCSSFAEPSMPEDPAASTSGHRSSTKRSREESPSEQSSVKRHKWDLEGSLQESAPSTSGLTSSTPRRHWLSCADCPLWLDDSDSD